MIISIRVNPLDLGATITQHLKKWFFRSSSEVVKKSKSSQEKLLARKDGSLGELWGRTLCRQTRAPNNINTACLIP